MNYKYSYSGTDAVCWAYYPQWYDLISRTQNVSYTNEDGDEVQRPLTAQEALFKELTPTDDQISGLYAPRDPVPVKLNAMHTISISVHEPRGPARSLGYRNVKGFARSVRTIAGSIIMTVIHDHPLRDLMESAKNFGGVWSVDLNRFGTGSLYDGSNYLIKLPTLLPAFNIMSVYMSELPSTDYESWHSGSGSNSVPTNYAGFLLEGVELIGEGMTTSVNDMVTEIVYQFVATNYRELSANISSLGEVDPLNLARVFTAYQDRDESTDASLREKLLQEEQALAGRSMVLPLGPTAEQGVLY